MTEFLFWRVLALHQNISKQQVSYVDFSDKNIFTLKAVTRTSQPISACADFCLHAWSHCYTMHCVARDCKTNSTFLVFMSFNGFLGGTRGICSNSHFYSSVLNVYIHGSLFEIQSAWVKVQSTMRPTKFSVTLRPPLLRLVTAETWIIMKETAFISTTLPHCTRLSHRGNAHFLLCTFSSLKRRMC